jgi:hypothetical protein
MRARSLVRVLVVALAVAVAPAACSEGYAVRARDLAFAARFGPDAADRIAVRAVRGSSMPLAVWLRADRIMKTPPERSSATHVAVRGYNRTTTAGAALVGASVFTAGLMCADMFSGFPLGFVTSFIIIYIEWGLTPTLLLTGAITWIVGAATHPQERDAGQRGVLYLDDGPVRFGGR